MPNLPHIWLQAGHAAKESDDLSAAAIAYTHAAALSTNDVEPHIHLGHISKLNGHLDSAGAHYLAALRRQPESLAAASELIRTAGNDTDHGRRLLMEAVGLLGINLEKRDVRVAEQPREEGIFFDVTDLLGYFSHARLPTGIQRVQIELVTAALNASRSTDVEACCFSEARKGWSVLPRRSFRSLATASLTSDDRADPLWRREVISTLLENAAEPNIQFGPRSALVNIGASWSERNYFLHLRNAREIGGPFYIPMLHDCIPMVNPDWFPSALVRDYRAWFTGLFHHADAFFAVSRATGKDLRRFGAQLHPSLSSPMVKIASPDGDFRNDHHGDHEATLAQLGLDASSFVLMVSTIEPRKNHAGAFAAWSALLDMWPARDVPTLVCVGGRGWMNDVPYAMLKANRRLRRKVIILHGVSDADLAILYSACLFTLYPSFYEGWGLPVTESLCYGKVPATSNTTSMPEAGGGFACYFDPHDVADIAQKVADLVKNTARRELLEARIRADYVPRPWSVIAETMLDDICAFTKGISPGPIRPARTDEARSFSFAADPGIKHESADILRIGEGWTPPGPQGSGVLRGSAMLRLPPSQRARYQRIWLRVTAPFGDARHVTVASRGELLAESGIAGGTSYCFECVLSVDRDQDPTLTIFDRSALSTISGTPPEDGYLLVNEIRIEPFS